MANNTGDPVEPHDDHQEAEKFDVAAERVADHLRECDESPFQETTWKGMRDG